MHRILYLVKCYFLFIVFSLHCTVLLIIALLPHLQRVRNEKNNLKKCMHKIMICISSSESCLILCNPPLEKINNCEYYHTELSISLCTRLPLKTWLSVWTFLINYPQKLPNKGIFVKVFIYIALSFQIEQLTWSIYIRIIG